MTVRFGALTHHTVNLGDDIQSLAAQRFLPRVDLWVDRDRTDALPPGEPVAVILNGWFGRGTPWPPGPRLRPLLLSFHVAEGPWGDDALLAGPALDFYRRFGPVGCRDRGTLRRLRERDVEAYFSGCLTLTLDIPPLPREDHVLAVDLAFDEPAETRRACSHRLVEHLGADRVRWFTHWVASDTPALSRMVAARRALELFGRARMVVTSRLHCVLPCLALGVPALFVRPRREMGRLDGLLELTNHCSSAEFLDGNLSELVQPRPNPDGFKPLADALRKKCRDFVHGFSSPAEGGQADRQPDQPEGKGAVER